jgi:hypothetical protein
MINFNRVNARLLHFIGLARAQNIDLETFIENERDERLRRIQERPLTPPPVFTDEILRRWFNSETEQVSLLLFYLRWTPRAPVTFGPKKF